MNEIFGGSNVTTDTHDLAAFLGEMPPSRWLRLFKWGVLIAFALLLVLLVSRCARGGPGPDYITEPIRRGSLELSVTATGNIRPTNMVQVGSEISGKIDRVFVDVNNQVAQGQVIAAINTDLIDDQIRQARASLAAAKAAVVQAQVTLNVDRAQLGRLESVYQNSGGKVPSKTELEAARGAVSRDQASIASGRANVEAAQATQSSAQTTRTRAVIRSPVAGVVLARQVEPGQTVAASFSTPTLFIIAEDLSAMQLRVLIDEADIGQVLVGNKATFTVDAYPGRKFEAVVERIDLASTNTANIANSSASTSTSSNSFTSSVVQFEARLTVNNVDGLLRPGMTATAIIKTASTGDQFLVPNGAFRFKPDQKKIAENEGILNPQVGLGKKDQSATIGAGSTQTIYLLGADGKLTPYAVITGQSDGRLSAIRSDKLMVGMKVVTGIQAATK